MQNFKLSNWSCVSSLLAVLAAASVGCETGSGTGGVEGTGGTTGGASATGGTTGGASATGGTTGAVGATGGTTGAVGATGGTTGAVGTGGTTGTTGPAVLPVATGICAGAATRPLSLDQAKIDNFEDAAISPGWSTFNDVMPVGNAFKMMQVAGGAVGTAHAAHYAGTGAKAPPMGYGVGAIFNAAIDKAAGTYCVDVTAFDGVTFWAKAAKAGAKVGVNFIVPETSYVDDGGDCKTKTACYQHPYKTVTLTTEWAQYSVPFSMAAGGTAKVNGRIQQLGWLSPDTDWDFSIDEIQFYKGTPPTTPAL